MKHLYLTPLFLLLFMGNCNNKVEKKPVFVPAKIQVNFSVVEEQQCNLALNLDSLRDKIKKLNYLTSDTVRVNPLYGTLNQ